MNQINLETLINELNSSESEESIIEFEGIITAKITINNIEIKENSDYIEIRDIDKKEIKNEIKLSKHQIMKIEKNRSEFIIKFDGLQEVKIKQKNRSWFFYFNVSAIFSHKLMYNFWFSSGIEFRISVNIWFAFMRVIPSTK